MPAWAQPRPLGQFHAATCIGNQTEAITPQIGGYRPADDDFRAGLYREAFTAYYQQFFCPAPDHTLNQSIWPPPEMFFTQLQMRELEDAFWLPSQGECSLAAPRLLTIIAREPKLGEARLMLANCEWSLGLKKPAIEEWTIISRAPDTIGRYTNQRWTYVYTARAMLDFAKAHP